MRPTMLSRCEDAAGKDSSRAKIRRNACCALLLLSLPAMHTSILRADAQDTAQSVTQPASSVEDGKLGGTSDDSPSSSFGAWGQLLLAMAIVIAMIVALGWLVKRLSGGGTRQNAGVLRLIARTNLSPKHQMFLVRMGNRLVLIGAGPQGLATLSEITDAAEASELLQSAGFPRLNAEGGRA